jgi:hypothetical protein
MRSYDKSGYLWYNGRSYDKNVYLNGKIYVYFIGFLISTADVTSIIIIWSPGTPAG